MHNLLSFWMIRFLWNPRLRQEKWVYGGGGWGVGELRMGGRFAGIEQWRSRLSRSYYGFFFPFYICGYGITVGWFFFFSPSSKTELRASKQYCFLNVPPFTSLSAPQKLCVGEGVGRNSFSNTSSLACFSLHPLTHLSKQRCAERSRDHLTVSCSD